MTTAALTARAIRKELEKTHPNTKFRIRSENFAGGDAVNISYIDSCPTEEIKKLTDKYQYGHFDSHQDMYESSNNRDDIPQTKYIQVTRELSDTAKKQLTEKLMRYWDLPDFGQQTVWDKVKKWPDMLLWEEAARTTFPT